MARWHNLPPEIKYSILTQFSSDLVNDFTHWHSDPWESQEYDSVQDGQWSNYPLSLRSFSAALRTCREFFDSLANVVKINGETPGVLLQREQYRVLRNLLDAQYEEDASGVIEIGFLYWLAGCFWRHPDIFEDLRFLGEVLMWITPMSRRMLIPNLEPWLLYHARPNLTIIGEPLIFVGIGGDMENCQLIIRLIEGALKLHNPEFPIVSIDGVAFPDSPDDEEGCSSCGKLWDSVLNIAQDIKHSDPDTWWFFPPEDYGIAVDENQWSLVNYRLRKIYSGPDGSRGYSWGNAWDIDTSIPVDDGKPGRSIQSEADFR